MLNFLITLQALIADRRDRDDEGATMVEYGLMVALIAVIVINNHEAARHDAVAEQTASGPRA